MLRATFLALTLWTVGAAHAGDRGVTPTEIRLGASAVLSGPLGPQTIDYGAGTRLYFDAINAQGGVNGRKISDKLLDDGFDPKRAVENTRKLIEEDNIFMVFNNTGTAHTMAIMPLAEETRTIVFGPVTGSSALRNKVSPHLFHVRAGRNLTTASFAQAMEELGEISFGRFVAKYSATSHNGSSYVELAIIDSQGNLLY